MLANPGRRSVEVTEPTGSPFTRHGTECGTSIRPCSATSSWAPDRDIQCVDRQRPLARPGIDHRGPKNFSASPFLAAPNQVRRSRTSTEAMYDAGPAPGATATCWELHVPPDPPSASRRWTRNTACPSWSRRTPSRPRSGARPVRGDTVRGTGRRCGTAGATRRRAHRNSGGEERSAGTRTTPRGDDTFTAAPRRAATGCPGSARADRRDTGVGGPPEAPVVGHDRVGTAPRVEDTAGADPRRGCSRPGGPSVDVERLDQVRGAGHRCEHRPSPRRARQQSGPAAQCGPRTSPGVSSSRRPAPRARRGNRRGPTPAGPHGDHLRRPRARAPGGDLRRPGGTPAHGRDGRERKHARRDRASSSSSR